MVLMTADLNDAQGLAGAVPRDRYVVRLEEGNGGLVQRPNKGNAQMLVISCVIDAGEHKDHRIFPPYRVMIAGTKEDGSRHNLGRMCELINACGIEWTCQGCGYVGGKGNKQLVPDRKTGNYHCPQCATRAGLSWETDDVISKRVVARVDCKKAGDDTDELINEVKGVNALA